MFGGRGKFIVLYGANNLGKSTQAHLLVASLQEKGIQARYLKYPIYDLEPTGPAINGVLRGGVKMPTAELQRQYAQNRRDYEPTLKKDLEKGIWQVTEDYTGTGIAWGMTYGLTLEYLEEINKGLLAEDLSLMFDGERFLSGIETNHLHETGGHWEKAQQINLELARKYGWKRINANAPKEIVAESVWREVAPLFLATEPRVELTIRRERE